MKKKTIITIGIVMVLLIGAWYIAALLSFNKNEAKANQLTEEIDNVRLKLKKGNSYRKIIDYESLLQFASIYPQKKKQINEVAEKFNSNLINAFWLSSSRNNKQDEILELVRSGDALYAEVKIVLNELHEINMEFVSVMQACENENSEAIALLNSDSDAKIFSDEVGRLAKKRKSCEEFLVRIESYLSTPNFEGGAGQLRNAVLGQMKTQTQSMGDKLSVRKDALLYINNYLRDYKKELLRSVGPQFSMTRTMNDIAREYHPVLSMINDKIAPLQEIMDKLEAPIRVFGASVSAIDMIKKIDPSTGKMIEAIGMTLDMLERMYNEVNEIIRKTEPFLKASEDYRRNRSRSNMLKLVEASIIVKSYFESKRNIFQDITARLDEVSGYIYQIDAAAARVPSNRAKQRINELTRGTRQIINIAYEPFNTWQGIVDNTSEAVDHLSLLESNYMSEIATASKAKLNRGDFPDVPDIPVASANGIETYEPGPAPADFTFDKLKITNLLKEYYNLLEKEQLESLRSYYTDPLESWYANENISVSKIIGDAQKYYQRYPYHAAKIDWGSMSMQSLDNGNVRIVYGMDYWVKKTSSDDYKYFDLAITVDMNRQYLIYRISEKILSSGIDPSFSE